MNQRVSELRRKEAAACGPARAPDSTDSGTLDGTSSVSFRRVCPRQPAWRPALRRTRSAGFSLHAGLAACAT